MAETVILAETTYEGFADGEFMVSPAPFVLTEGETYRVVWDGVEHECECILMEGIPAVMDIVPDENFIPLKGTFALAYYPPGALEIEGGAVLMLAYDLTSDTMFDTVNTSHTVAIYQGTAEETEDKDYLIKGSTLKGIADAIRTKSGATGEIAVADMATQIAAITGGGGGSSDVEVVWVTFMSHDGTKELHKRAVVPGNDCMCPVAGGLIDAPTKESTAAQNFTFSGGWATEVNGGIDENALKAVTEDRTVYANYIATTRYHTISYYDGDTLLKSESLAYGAMPSYTTEKEGFYFEGWEPVLATVTGDATYYAKWTEKLNFASVSWADIIAVAEAGEASTKLSVGDERTETITYADGTTEEITWVIADFGKCNVLDADGNATVDNMTICAKHALSETRALDTDNTLSYSVCALTTFLDGNFFNALPEALQGAIKRFDLTSFMYGKVWIPSYGQLGLTLPSGARNPGNTAVALDLFSDDASRVRTLGKDGSATAWVTRTYYKNGDDNVKGLVTTAGQAQTSGYTFRRNSVASAIVPFFCI